jgi:hypothetical protein
MIGVPPHLKRVSDGFVLPLLLLLLLALTALAHSALLVATAEFRMSRIANDLAVAQQAAEGVLVQLPGALAGLPDRIRVGESVLVDVEPVPTAILRAAVSRLSRESWFVQAEAQASEGRRASEAAVFWRMDPIARLARLGGTVTVPDGVSRSGAARVETDSLWTGAECVAMELALDSAFVAGSLRGVESSYVAGSIGLGAITMDDIHRLVPPTLGRSGTPAPLDSLGNCAQAVWNWGGSDPAGTPCGLVHVVRSSTGDVDIVGGEGRGLIIIDGDLTLRDGSSIVGMLLVTGRLRLTNGAYFRGMAFAGEGIRVDPSAHIVGSICVAAASLNAASGALGVFLPLVGATRLGQY